MGQGSRRQRGSWGQIWGGGALASGREWHRMTTRWQHCSAEKAAPRCVLLGVSVPERREQNLPLPLTPKGPVNEAGFQGNKYLPHQLLPVTVTANSMRSPHGPGRPFTGERGGPKREVGGWPQVLQSSSLILPLLPEPETVAGRAVGAEEVGKVAFTFPGLWVQEVLSTSEEEKGGELRAAHILGDPLEATKPHHMSRWRGS